MIPFLIFLVFPLVGGLLWLARRRMMRGEDDSEREFGRRALIPLGVVAIGLSLLSAAWGVVDTPEHREIDTPGLILAIEILFKLIVVAMLAIPGWLALRVAWKAQNQDESLLKRAEYSAAQDQLEIFSLLLLGMPLLLFSPILCVLLMIGFAIEMLLLTYVQRERQNRLIWTLAFAAHQNRPLEDGIDELILTARGKYRRLLESFADSLENGTPLSQALLTSPGLLPLEAAGMIRSAEEHGTMAATLRRIGIEQSARIRNRSKMQSLAGTAMYLTALVLVMVMIVSFLSYFIVPKLLLITEEFGLQLPQMTRHLSSWSSLVVDYWYLIMPLTTVPFVLMMAIASASSGGLRLPASLRSFWPRLSTPMLLRSLSDAAREQKSLLPILKSLAESTIDTSLRLRYERIALRVEMGEALPAALEHERVVRPREANAMEHASQMGHLPWAMRSLANRIDRTRIHRLASLAEWLQPLVIIAFGLIVLAVALGCLLPLFQMIGWDLS